MRHVTFPFKGSLKTSELNQRFADIAGGSILQGFRLKKGTGFYSVSISRDGAAESVLLTKKGVRLTDDGESPDAIRVSPNMTAQDRYDVIYVIHESHSPTFRYEIQEGVSGEGVQLIQTPELRTAIGYVRVRPNQTLTQADLTSYPLGLRLGTQIFEKTEFIESIKTKSLEIEGKKASTEEFATQQATTEALAKAQAALDDSKTYTNGKLDALIGSAPGTLDTLKEIADALGNDAQLSSKVIETRTEVTNARGTFATLKERMDLQKYYVNVKEFGAKGDGVTDDTLSFQRAIDFANSINARVFVPYGRYAISKISVVDNGLDILGQNAVIIKTTTDSVFYAKGGWENVVPVTAINTGEVATATQNDTYSELTAAIPAKLGDVLKIVSDDRLEPALSSQIRKGEFFIVRSAVNGKVLTTSLLGDTYTTNVRIGRLKKHAVRIEGLTFEVLPSLASLPHKAVIQLAACLSPQLLNLKCYDAYGTFILLSGCYDYTVSNVTVQNLANYPGLSQYGYGIADASEMGKVSNSTFTNCRHGYTTVSGLISTNNSSDLEGYGRQYGSLISNCTGIACTASSFDTHAGARNITFKDCVSRGSHPFDGSGSGFQARGNDIKFFSCNSDQDHGGFLLFEHDVNTSKEALVIGCSVTNAKKYGIQVESKEGMRMEGVLIKDTTLSAKIPLQLVYSDVTIDNVTLKVLDAGDDAHAVTLSNSTLDIKSSHIDASYLRSDVALGARLLWMTTANSEIKCDSLRITSKNAKVAAVFETLAAPTSPVYLGEIVTDKAIAITRAINSFYRACSTDRQYRSAHIVMTEQFSNAVVKCRSLLDPHLFVSYNQVDANGDKTIGAFEEGSFVGQFLTLRFTTNNSANLIIPSDVANRKIKMMTASKTCLNETIVKFLWVGTFWQEIA